MRYLLLWAGTREGKAHPKAFFELSSRFPL
jgi:hypothetical protein